MLKQVDPSTKERAVRLLREHASEYPSMTAGKDTLLHIGQGCHTGFPGHRMACQSAA